jgi:hypothetical protein
MKKPVPTAPFDADVPMAAEKAAKERREKTVKRIRFQIPYVAAYIARIVTQNLMDYESAAKQILEASEVNYAVGTLAEKLENDPNIQAAIQKELSTSGLDDASQAEFLKEVWFQFRHGAKDLKKVAMQVLAKGFITDKAGDDKPQPLVIKGMEEGVKKMGLFDKDEPLPGPESGSGSESIN